MVMAAFYACMLRLSSAGAGGVTAARRLPVLSMVAGAPGRAHGLLFVDGVRSSRRLRPGLHALCLAFRGKLCLALAIGRLGVAEDVEEVSALGSMSSALLSA